MWEWSLVLGERGSVKQAKKKKNENAAICSWLCYMNNCVL